MTKIENNDDFGMRNPNFIMDFPENAIFRKIDLNLPTSSIVQTFFVGQTIFQTFQTIFCRKNVTMSSLI